jgi:hypothetical protein
LSGLFAAFPFAAGEMPGLRAIPKSHRARIAFKDAKNARNVVASADVDSTLRYNPTYSNAPRWDYIIWYGGAKPYLPCVEVHPADSSHVNDVIAKRDWLETLLRGAAVPARKYYWIPTSSVSISKTGPSYRRLMASGISLRRIVTLD